MAKRKTHKYTGVLARPIYVPLQIASALKPDDVELREQASAEHMGQYLERLVALAEDCGVEWVEPIKWWQIALVLAERHVPAFSREVDYLKGPATRGRPKWKASGDLPVVIAVAKRVAKGHSIRRASELVAKERGKGESWAAIERRYRRFNERTEAVASTASLAKGNMLATGKSNR